MKIFIKVLYFLLIFNVFNTGQSADPGVCYPPLGCFNITDDFRYSLIYRPINVLPESPNKLSTHIIFYSRNPDPKTQQILDKKWYTRDQVSDKLDNFDGSKDTKFIIHGFLDGQSTGKWMVRMKNELLAKGDYNVFLVDWSEWNGMPYSQAAANCRVVGAQIALLVKNLNVSHKLKYNLVHLIGHSLGSHLAGYAGKQVKKYSAKIGRITALDPAEPYFQYMPSTVRLDRSDADFVDVMHTDSKSILQLGLGMSQPIGHIDFYPNGGHEQPGCSQARVSSFLSGSFLNGNKSGEFFACNHMRATEYFTESINGERNGCHFKAYACESWTAFNTKSQCKSCGKSGGLCSSMGLNAIQWKRFKSNKKSKLFYLKTDSRRPFCVFQVKIEIPIDSIGAKSGHYTGTIRLKMGSGVNTISTTLEELNLSSDNTYYSVITLRDEKLFSSLDSIDFEWFEVTFDVFDPNTWRFTIFNQDREQDNQVIKKALYIKQIILRPLSPGYKSKKFCNKNSGTAIKPNDLAKFNKNC